MKRLIAILLTLVIAISLVGCGNSGKWYELPKSKPYGYTYYVNVDYEDLEIGTYNVLYSQKGSSTEEGKPAILYVYEDQYDLVITYEMYSAGDRGISVVGFPK